MISLRARRLLAASVLAVSAAAFFLAYRSTPDGADGMLRLAVLFGVLLVAGTLAFGLALWLLRCPRCGKNLGRSIAGGDRLGEKSSVHAFVALIRPLHCEACGFEERHDGS